MPIKGYSKDRTVRAMEALDGEPVKKPYYILNIGIRQLSLVKEFYMLLKSTETDKVRLLGVRMHRDELNWGMLRSILGSKNPADSKHIEASDALCEYLCAKGGISIAERRTTRQVKGKTSNIFVFHSLELFDVGEEHPGIHPFSISGLRVEQIKSLIETADALPTDTSDEGMYYEPQEEAPPKAPDCLSWDLAAFSGKLNRDCFKNGATGMNALFSHYQGLAPMGAVDLIATLAQIDLTVVAKRIGAQAAAVLGVLVEQEKFASL
jgi:hypothetical protein